MGRISRKYSVMPRCFTAIDFETADNGRDSACFRRPGESG